MERFYRCDSCNWVNHIEFLTDGEDRGVVFHCGSQLPELILLLGYFFLGSLGLIITFVFYRAIERARLLKECDRIQDKIDAIKKSCVVLEKENVDLMKRNDEIEQQLI